MGTEAIIDCSKVYSSRLRMNVWQPCCDWATVSAKSHCKCNEPLWVQRATMSAKSSRCFWQTCAFPPTTCTASDVLISLRPKKVNQDGAALALLFIVVRLEIGMLLIASILVNVFLFGLVQWWQEHAASGDKCLTNYLCDSQKEKSVGICHRPCIVPPDVHFCPLIASLPSWFNFSGGRKCCRGLTDCLQHSFRPLGRHIRCTFFDVIFAAVAAQYEGRSKLKKCRFVHQCTAIKPCLCGGLNSEGS